MRCEPVAPPHSTPVAVCGYRLRAPHEEVRLDDLTFEDRWLLTDDCCTECGAVLELEEPSPPATAPKSEHNWALGAERNNTVETTAWIAEGIAYTRTHSHRRMLALDVESSLTAQVASNGPHGWPNLVPM
jgi:hypothetical protein